METFNNNNLANNTLTNSDQQYSQDSSPSMNTQDNRRLNQAKPKKYGKIIVIFIIFILAISLLCVVKKGLFGPPISEYQKYLEDKYGKDEGFSYAGIHNCPFFNAGFCEQLFTSEKSNKEFIVNYNRHYTSKFSDQYYLAKYDKEFEKYYYEKYGKYFKDIIPYDYNISIDAIYPKYSLEKKLSSFNEIINDIENNETYNWSMPSIIINLDYKAISAGKIENIDFNTIKLQINDLMQKNKIQLHSKATINIEINMVGSGRTGLCPNGFDTYGHNRTTFNINDPDKEIFSCQKLLYKQP